MDGDLSLRHHRDEFYLWDRRKYAVYPDGDLKARVADYLAPGVKGLTRNVVGNIVEFIRAQTLVPSSQEMPRWIGKAGPFPAEEAVVFRNGILHLPAVAEGNAELHELTPRLFTTNAVDYAYDPDRGCPEFFEFLSTLWARDQESIETLQEVFGYLLSRDRTQQKIFMVVGPRRAGKGSLGRLLRVLVGSSNLATPKLHEFAQPFGLAGLLNKPVALISDARLSHRTDAVAVVETLLSISGEDPQNIPRKFLPTITGVMLPTRFLLLTNELPQIKDASSAFSGRVILL